MASARGGRSDFLIEMRTTMTSLLLSSSMFRRPRHLLKPMSVQMKRLFVGSALEAVLAAAAKRPPSNEDSPLQPVGRFLGRLRRSFVTVVVAIALSGAPLLAHDMWIEPTTFFPEPGQIVGVRLRVG